MFTPVYALVAYIVVEVLQKSTIFEIAVNRLICLLGRLCLAEVDVTFEVS